jgi:ElaB/YqjD/DUF883 family membrane-anchored ribosome-binding protein
VNRNASASHPGSDAAAGNGQTSPSARVSESAIDEIQALIGIIEEMLGWLDERAVTSASRLRRKLNENVRLARGSVAEVSERGSDTNRRAWRLAAIALGLSSLGGFALGLLLARPRRAE